MHLDTDCVLALIKEEDWLKESVLEVIDNEDSLKTSIITILECRLVLTRDDPPNRSLDISGIVSGYNITILPYDSDIERLSLDLLKKHSS